MPHQQSGFQNKIEKLHRIPLCMTIILLISGEKFYTNSTKKLRRWVSRSRHGGQAQAHLGRLPLHHHHLLPHCKPAQPACLPHTHLRYHHPHYNPPV